MAFPDELAHAMKPGADGLLLLREGIERAELVNTVSPRVCPRNPRHRSSVWDSGFLWPGATGSAASSTGSTLAVWDPATDAALPANYSRGKLAGKAECRQVLLDGVGFRS